jgi:hypothetical protein
MTPRKGVVVIATMEAQFILFVTFFTDSNQTGNAICTGKARIINYKKATNSYFWSEKRQPQIERYNYIFATARNKTTT